MSRTAAIAPRTIAGSGTEEALEPWKVSTTGPLG